MKNIFFIEIFSFETGSVVNEKIKGPWNSFKKFHIKATSFKEALKVAEIIFLENRDMYLGWTKKHFSGDHLKMLIETFPNYAIVEGEEDRKIFFEPPQ